MKIFSAPPRLCASFRAHWFSKASGCLSLLDMDVAYLIFPKVDGIKRQAKVLQELGVLKG